MPRLMKVSDPKAVSAAAAVLRAGGLIVFPTETCYGLGADAANMPAVRRVHRLKGIALSKPISSMVADKAMARRFFGRDRRVDSLVDSFLPGPLTIIRKGKSFRVPAHRFCLRLAKTLGRPITSTSANLTGKGECYNIRSVLSRFRAAGRLDKIDLIIDGGRLPRRKPSTVFDVDSMMVLREGPISRKSLCDALR